MLGVVEIRVSEKDVVMIGRLYFRVINRFINIYQGLVNMDVGDLNMNGIRVSEYFDY